MRWSMIPVVTCTWALLAFGAGAEESAPRYEPKQAHAEADKNGDGAVDREEFHQRMVEVFFHGDRDKDGYMTFAELEQAVLFPDDFRDADRDGDGRISLYEFIRVRFEDFDEVDSDSDGLLSVEEVRVAFEERGS